MQENQKVDSMFTLGRLFLRHLNLVTLANFWKSLNLSGAKIKVLLFFSFFDQTGD